MAVYRIGSKGDEVRKIQERLQASGFYKGPIDGDFGGGTEAAVKRFQKANGLTADGIVGPITWKTLFNEKILEPPILEKPQYKGPETPAYKPGYIQPGLIIKRAGSGATDRQIRDLQRDLRRLGYLKSGIDGDFGRATELAIKALQHDLLLYYMEGVLKMMAMPRSVFWITTEAGLWR